MRRLLFLALLIAASGSALAQDVDVTFRFLPDLTAPAISPVQRAFVPGSFNDWGQTPAASSSPVRPRRRHTILS